MHDTIPSEPAPELYASAVSLVPSISDHLRIPTSQRFVNGVNEAWSLLERAVALDSAHAPAYAARGNILVRGGFLDDARAAYARAAEIDVNDAGVRYALAELAFLAHDEAAAAGWFREAFDRRRLFSPPHPRAGARNALMLCHAGPWPANIPLDFLLDDRHWTLHRWFLPDPNARTQEVPDVDIIIDALGESVAGRAAIADAEFILAGLRSPAINDPRRLRGLGRDRLATTLAHVPGVRVAGATRVARAEIPTRAAEFAYPLLVRPIDSHSGRGLERIDDRSLLDAYLARVDAPVYDCSAFIDYRSADGWYRKYRLTFVDGVAYPYHLAIHDRWMVHYHRTATTETAWMNAEEAQFLTEPERVLAAWTGAIPALGEALGLDYASIDCAQLADGTLLVFEADTAMLIHALDVTEPARVKRAAAARISDALTSLMERRARK